MLCLLCFYKNVNAVIQKPRYAPVYVHIQTYTAYNTHWIQHIPTLYQMNRYCSSFGKCQEPLYYTMMMVYVVICAGLYPIEIYYCKINCIYLYLHFPWLCVDSIECFEIIHFMCVCNKLSILHYIWVDFEYKIKMVSIY